MACLPGPVALFLAENDLLAVDLRVLRSHLVYRRMLRELGGGKVAAQVLLSPVVLHRDAEDIALCIEARNELAELGLDVEAFGDDAIVVRAVPAHLRACIEDAEIDDLVDRVIPWLRLQRSGSGETAHALRAMAQTRGSDPAPRLARRWVQELLEEGATLDDIPGLRRWRADELVAEEGDA